MKLVPFDSSSALPAYLTADASYLDVNKEVVRAQGFPVMSIKGMKFTLNKDGVKKVVTKPDDPDEVAQSLGVVFVRANLNAKTFYMKKYEEGESDNVRPTCYSQDGQAPSANAQEPQSAKCAICKHNQWGSKISESGKEGKMCQDNARIAISAPDALDPMLLRVPPASLKNLRETLKIIAARKVPYNSVVIKVGFDRESPSPKLTFKPVGLLDDAGFGAVREVYDEELVRSIVGLDDFGMDPVAAKPAAVDADELDAALAARDATKKAAAKLPPPEPKAEPKKPAVVEDEDDAPPKKAKAEPKAETKKSGASDLMADLDDLLGTKDD